jgi:hypothetical protein
MARALTIALREGNKGAGEALMILIKKPKEEQVRTWWKIEPEAVGRRGYGGMGSTRGVVRISVAFGGSRGFKRSTFAREIFRNKTYARTNCYVIHVIQG